MKREALENNKSDQISILKENVQNLEIDEIFKESLLKLDLRNNDKYLKALKLTNSGLESKNLDEIN